MTVDHIAEWRRGISRRGFYNIFRTKEEAFIATYETAFQYGRSRLARRRSLPRAPGRSEFGKAGSPSRASSLREPLLAYIGFVECFALGREFAQRVHDTQLAYTLFLEDGYRQRPVEAQLLSRTCSTLTSCAIFEAGFQATLRGPGLYMRRSQPLAVYVALTPFIGRTPAGEFVWTKAEHLRGSAERAGRAQHGQPCAPSS